MFPNPASDARNARAADQQHRQRIHATADAIYRAVADCTDAEVVAALLQQLRALTARKDTRS